MLSVTESMLIETNKQNVLAAEKTIARLESELLRVQNELERQEAVNRNQTAQMAADAASIAGYRAYVEFMRSVSDRPTLEKASDAYVVARDEKAKSLGITVVAEDAKQAA